LDRECEKNKTLEEKVDELMKHHQERIKLKEDEAKIAVRQLMIQFPTLLIRKFFPPESDWQTGTHTIRDLLDDLDDAITNAEGEEKVEWQHKKGTLKTLLKKLGWNGEVEELDKRIKRFKRNNALNDSAHPILMDEAISLDIQHLVDTGKLSKGDASFCVKIKDLLANLAPDVIR